MNNQDTKLVDIISFRKQMNNPDQDYAINELESIMQKFEHFHEIQFTDKSKAESFISTLVGAAAVQNAELKNAALRTIVLSTYYLDLELIPTLYKYVFTTMEEEGSHVTTQLCTVIKEILTNHSNMNYERCRELIKTIFPYFQNLVPRDEYTRCLIEILASLLENIGSLFNPDEIQSTIDRFLPIFKNFNDSTEANYLNLISSLVKFWSFYATQEQINICVDNLLQEEILKTPAPILILSTSIGANPVAFENHLLKLFELFIKVFNSASTNETEDDDIDDFASTEDDIADSSSTDIIKEQEYCINAIATMWRAFPEEMAQFFDQTIPIFTKYIIYGSSGVVSSSQMVEDEVILAEEDMDDDDDMDLTNDEQIDIDDDTWRLRKASAALGIALMHSAKESFLEIVKDIELFQRILAVSDIASLKDILEMVREMFVVYNKKLTDEYKISIIQAINKQITPDSQFAHDILYLLSPIIRVIGLVDEDFLLTPISAFKGKLTSSVATALVTCIETAASFDYCSDSFINICCEAVLDCSKAGCAESLCIEAASLLFQSFRPLSPEISDLANYCIENSSKKELVVTISRTLAIFSANFDHENLTKRAVEVISSYLADQLAVSNVLSALSLVTVSKQYKYISSECCQMIINEIKSQNNTNRFRSLFCIFSLLENDKQMTDKKNLINSLKIAFTTSQSGSLKYILLILKKIIETKSDINEILPSLKTVLTSTIDKIIIEPSASLIAKMSEIDLDNSLHFIFDFTNSVKDDDDNIPNLAEIIAIAAVSNPNLTEKIVKDCQQKVTQKKPLSLRIIGEIGARKDISDLKDSIDFIFGLTDSQTEKREVFAAAAFSIGSISSLSESLQCQILEKAKQEEEKLSTWLIALESLTKQTKTKTKMFDQIADFLLTDRNNIKEENENPLAKSLANLAKIDNGFVMSLFDKCTDTNEEVAKISSHAIEYFVREMNVVNDIEIIDKLCSNLNEEKPLISYYLVSAVNYILEQNKRVDLSKYVKKFVSMSLFNQTHEIEVELGLSTIKKDIGSATRSEVLTVLSQIDDNNSINAVINGLKDVNIDVILRAMSLLTNICLNQPKVVSEKIQIIANNMKDLPKDLERKEKDALQHEYYNLLAALKRIPNINNNDIAEMLHTCEGKNQFELAVKDIGKRVQERRTKENIGMKSSVSEDVLHKFNKDAPLMFDQ
ncbi:hypothetical protein TVAG_120660 [Trichomonas vaginalis G3]|uniref:TATA-binding protein interacting (TIP20) domain-containing protein n=1 Tax=Trichomonas vaginalis (strain ATCC PRA-98 / G3) TaxID=412133 RepID=A2D7L1_TRIV3|nr:cullin-associated NEDD8-dissociated protein 1 family [Trichomonas vaginalis G3]EAY23728.1 hypothetical protein TVAG_120660 [Trichomonas vaginalis G3]KAI5490223.1 cullin-associated NEDD8-dissociated protein 1 family [Trichomonas vaginalis G3]|eukprot:XP_001276976.1 hypothetical protein [Trichomonas vaginalis G3]